MLWPVAVLACSWLFLGYHWNNKVKIVSTCVLSGTQSRRIPIGEQLSTSISNSGQVVKISSPALARSVNFFCKNYLTLFMRLTKKFSKFSFKVLLTSFSYFSDDVPFSGSSFNFRNRFLNLISNPLHHHSIFPNIENFCLLREYIPSWSYPVSAFKTDVLSFEQFGIFSSTGSA